MKSKFRKFKLKQRENPYKTISIFCVVALLLLGISFAASAKNGPQHQIPDSPKMRSIKIAPQTADMPEAMPAEAKPAKTRSEAKKVIAQIADSESAINYDLMGRIAKIVEPDSSVRQFVYSGNQLIEERDASGSVTKQFFNWGEKIGGATYTYTRDHLGSVTEMADQNGNIVAQYRYDPWGNATKIAGSGPDSDFLYAGYFFHKPSGLYITAHRLYSPKLGYWLNRDPVDDPSFALLPQSPELLSAPEEKAAAGSPLNPYFLPYQNSSRGEAAKADLAKTVSQANPYTYVKNNPINKVDPSGLGEFVRYVPCPVCCNNNRVRPSTCWLERRWSSQTNQWLYTVVTYGPRNTVCTAYGYNGWPGTPDKPQGFCKWLCN